MIKLNDVTQRIDSADFNTYRTSDLLDTVGEMTAGEIAGLKERLSDLEEKWQSNDDMNENFD